MQKRPLYILLLAIVAVAALLVVVFHREREPEYGGKKLSEWVMATSWETRPYSGSGWLSNGRREEHPVRTNEAAYAIRHMGTNALPYLLIWIRYEPPAWKTKLLPVMNRVFHLARVDQRNLRADAATRGVLILGEQAEGAVAGLARLVNDPKRPDTACRAKIALEDLSLHVVAANLALMTNQSWWVRAQSIYTALRSGTIRPALPAIVHCLQDTSDDVAMAAATVLGEAAIEPKAVVPSLTERLQDSRPNVRWVIIRALGEYRGQARSAIPALVAFLTDGDPISRRNVTDTLDQIDPQALERATQ